MLRPVLLALTITTMASVMVGGCASQHLPSPAEARQPTPGSVTRDKPGGDAANPVDAALERLLSEPIGHKHDKWRTLSAPFPDVQNWKRVRFWGYPTRAGFRYGKDPHIAVGMLSYAAAPDEGDSPIACMRDFIDEAEKTAGLFDVEIGDVHREIRTHARGVERVDWEQAAADWKIEKKRLAEERKERLAEIRKKKLERLRQVRERIRKRREAARRAKAAKDAAAKQGVKPSKVIPPSRAPSSGGPSETEGPPTDGKADEENKEARLGLARKRQALRLRRIDSERPTHHRAAPSKEKPEDAEAAKRRKRRREHLSELRERQLAQPHRSVPKPKNLPPSEMAVLRTSGKLNTLFARDHYEVAVVAYESWPGTCLVQGFAVRVGTDLTLARQVVTRWLDDAAPKVAWATWLREKPPFENR